MYVDFFFGQGIGGRRLQGPIVFARLTGAIQLAPKGVVPRLASGASLGTVVKRSAAEPGADLFGGMAPNHLNNKTTNSQLITYFYLWSRKKK